jgi:hypothetical protein
VLADDVVGHAFSHGFHPQHVERLAAYWAEALGGSSTYSDSYGDETTVVRPNGDGRIFFRNLCTRPIQRPCPTAAWPAAPGTAACPQSGMFRNPRGPR